MPRVHDDGAEGGHGAVALADGGERAVLEEDEARVEAPTRRRRHRRVLDEHRRGGVPGRPRAFEPGPPPSRTDRRGRSKLEAAPARGWTLVEREARRERERREDAGEHTGHTGPASTPSRGRARFRSGPSTDRLVSCVRCGRSSSSSRARPGVPSSGALRRGVGPAFQEHLRKRLRGWGLRRRDGGPEQRGLPRRRDGTGDHGRRDVEATPSLSLAPTRRRMLFPRPKAAGGADTRATGRGSRGCRRWKRSERGGGPGGEAGQGAGRRTRRATAASAATVHADRSHGRSLQQALVHLHLLDRPQRLQQRHPTGSRRVQVCDARLLRSELPDGALDGVGRKLLRLQRRRDVHGGHRHRGLRRVRDVHRGGSVAGCSGAGRAPATRPSTSATARGTTTTRAPTSQLYPGTAPDGPGAGQIHRLLCPGNFIGPWD